MTDPMTLGVEEELQILSADSMALTSRADDLLAGAPAGELLGELPRSQVEAVTTVCSSLAEVREQVVARRGIAAGAAIAAGLRIASCGTAPLAEWRINSHRDTEPYDAVEAFAGHLVREQLIAGMHVHVGIDDPNRAAAVLDRTRDWLPVLSALSASSPYWSGMDTGYASWRAVHWRRWPASGPTPIFESAARYDESVAALLASGVLTRESQVYWDARRSARFPTVEVRICDAVQTVDEVIALVGVIRGLAAMALRDHDAGVPLPRTDTEALRLAGWQAAKQGLAGELIMPGTPTLAPAAEVVQALLDRVRPVLGEDADQVEPVVRKTLASGGGAGRQRAAALGGGLRAAAELVVAETVAGVPTAAVSLTTVPLTTVPLTTVPVTAVPVISRVGGAVGGGRLDADEQRLVADRPPHHG